MIPLSIGIYAAAFVIGWRRSFRKWSHDQAPLTPGLFVMGLFIATATAMLLAIVGPIYLVYVLWATPLDDGGADRAARTLGGESEHDRTERREAELSDARRRVAELEKELLTDE